ncbi:hypothetical protein E3J79_03460 [Candidatus Dependentiae bacterium]|nr:MAG: hypothetical protein E3J79_03460 [Candidatus Dependentiae bacterium]
MNRKKGYLIVLILGLLFVNVPLVCMENNNPGITMSCPEDNKGLVENTGNEELDLAKLEEIPVSQEMSKVENRCDEVKDCCICCCACCVGTYNACCGSFSRMNWYEQHLCCESMCDLLRCLLDIIREISD